MANERPGRGGNVPPAEHRFKPGHKPKGRPSAGASVREWINVLTAKNLREDGLRRVARDKRATWAKRTAAERMLRTLEAPDLADFEEFLDGDASLSKMRERGINTEVVKKAKVRTRTLEDGTRQVEREVELFDRGGEEFDRVCDRTDGKPKQSIDVNAIHTILPADGAAELAAVADRLRGLLKPSAN